MTSPTTDRRLGVVGGQAIKNPVQAATTTNITLSGTQTIDGYSVASGDRILVQNQTSGVDNGIYKADSGTWTRDIDFDGSYDAVTGTIVYVINGTSNGNKFFQCTTTGTITIGTTSLAFSAVSVAFSGLSANAVATSNIQASAVTYAKIQSASAGNVMLGNATNASAAFAEVALAQNTLLGRGSTGNIAGITLGTGLSFSAAVLSAATALQGSQHRISLATATPVTTSDLTAQATVYMTPYNGTAVNIGGVSYSTSELSLALDSNSGHTGYHQSGKNFDLFSYISSGTTVGIGTGPSWSSDTSRGTGAGTTEITKTNGIYVNKNAITLRIGTNSGDTTSVAVGGATYLGTFRTTADGQTEDSAAKRFVWNYYNRVRKPMRVRDTTDSWTYNTAAFRQANNSAANQLDFVIGVSEDAVKASVCGLATTGTTTDNVIIGIKLDGTSSDDTATGHGINVTASAQTSVFGSPFAHYEDFIAAGRHFLAWVEAGTGSGHTVTWYGDNGGIGPQTGIIGELLG